MKTGLVEILQDSTFGVEALIFEYIENRCKQSGWCAPSLKKLADYAFTTRGTAMFSLEHLEQAGRIERQERQINGVIITGWTVPRQRRKQHQAAGFGGGDREFLRQCGVAAEG